MAELGKAATVGIRILFAFRMIMLIGSAGALVGAFLMFWQGTLHLVDAWGTLFGAGEAAPAAEEGAAAASHAVAAAGAIEEHAFSQITVPVLEAVDSFLFGVVLVIFCYSIAVGFVFRLPARIAAIVPSWMKVDGVGQLKQILAEVVIVVLIVIFARVIVESAGHFTWEFLVLPIAIILLAGAIWLLELGSHEAASHTAPDPHPDMPTIEELAALRAARAATAATPKDAH